MTAPLPRRPQLSERELQVLRGMADGLSNKEIGEGIFVTEDTVKTHARRLFKKLGARDRAHAVAIGMRRGALAGGDLNTTAQRVTQAAVLLTEAELHERANGDVMLARALHNLAQTAGRAAEAIARRTS